MLEVEKINDAWCVICDENTSTEVAMTTIEGIKISNKKLACWIWQCVKLASEGVVMADNEERKSLLVNDLTGMLLLFFRLNGETPEGCKEMTEDFIENIKKEKF